MLRVTTTPVDQLFLNRQSAYAFSGESIAQEQLLQLLEAARWAPSSYNNQPTRFIYAHRDTPAWQKLFDLMVPANQAWAQYCAVLVVIISKKTMPDGSPSVTNSLEAGSAWMSLALQAHLLGLSAHGMSGFHADRARTALSIPDGFKVEMMCAIGKPAAQHANPKYLERDAMPTNRKPLEEIAHEGAFCPAE